MIYDPNLHTNYRFGQIFSGWLFTVQGAGRSGWIGGCCVNVFGL